MLRTVVVSALLAVACSSVVAQDVGPVRVYIVGFEVDPNVSDPRSTAGYAKVLNESTGLTMTWNAPATFSAHRWYVRVPVISQSDVDIQRKRENERADILRQLAEARRMQDSRGLSLLDEVRIHNRIKQLLRQLQQLPP